MIPILTRAIAILSDFFVLTITWMKFADVWRMNLRLPARSRPKLFTLLIRDGEFTFVLSARKLTCLRYSVFRVSILFQKYAFHVLINKYFKCSVRVEYRDLGVGCDHLRARPALFNHRFYLRKSSVSTRHNPVNTVRLYNIFHL